MATASGRVGRPWGFEVRLRYGRLRDDFGLFGDDEIVDRKKFKVSCYLSVFEWGLSRCDSEWCHHDV